MIISNNIIKKFTKLPDDTIIRINIAWIKNKNELISIIKNCKYPVFYDYPYNRKKFPLPKTNIFDAIELANSYYKKIKYFALSNAEDKNFLEIIRLKLHSSIKIVPKIESKKGIEYLEQIMEACKTDIFMLDKEDLFTDSNMNNEECFKQINILKQKTTSKNYTMLTLQGVIFNNA